MTTDAADPEVTVPPGPPCVDCGVPCCLCWVLSSHPCTSDRPCDSCWFSEDEFDVWSAEVLHRARIWRTRNPHVARVLVDEASGHFGFTAPRRYAVEIGPHLPYEMRVRIAQETEACPLCAERGVQSELVYECDDATPCVWRVCERVEYEPDSGHLEIICL